MPPESTHPVRLRISPVPCDIRMIKTRARDLCLLPEGAGLNFQRVRHKNVVQYISAQLAMCDHNSLEGALKVKDIPRILATFPCVYTRSGISDEVGNYLCSKSWGITG